MKLAMLINLTLVVLCMLSIAYLYIWRMYAEEVLEEHEGRLYKLYRTAEEHAAIMNLIKTKHNTLVDELDSSHKTIKNIHDEMAKLSPKKKKKTDDVSE